MNLQQTKIMQQKIAEISAKLFGSGCFGHLPDEELSAIQHCIIQTKQHASRNMLLRLVAYWYKADFAENDTAFALLQECNIVLQNVGMHMIEHATEELYE